jgi:hypothetical protein
VRWTLLLLPLALTATLGAQGSPPVADPTAARLQALKTLPVTSDELRRAGVEAGAVRGTLAELQRGRVGAADAKTLLDAEREALRQGGQPSNFGQFVRAMQASGLRGQALAEAIHAEKARRGGDVRASPAQGRGGPPAGVGRGGDAARVGRGGAEVEAGRGGPPAGVGRGGAGGRGGPPAGAGRGGRGGGA